MRTTFYIEGELLAKAQQRITGLKEKTAPAGEGQRPLIEPECARRLARRGGNEPQLRPLPGGDLIQTYFCRYLYLDRACLQI